MLHSDHQHAPRAIAAAPTFSLLRLSAWQRLAGAGIVLAALWFLVLLVLA
ncbi:hypothetical protein [Microvirga alba]|uniref:Uncharacterized protein n=1 Tax=Microvirga alba TaxID=2791025 RepID=A0A931BRJ1_9HYPH|nr:hypothetical protein [Microvirga alba]MBF9234733.1 hypothetical protein [Microvirga alba]